MSQRQVKQLNFPFMAITQDELELLKEALLAAPTYYLCSGLDIIELRAPDQEKRQKILRLKTKIAKTLSAIYSKNNSGEQPLGTLLSINQVMYVEEIDNFIPGDDPSKNFKANQIRLREEWVEYLAFVNRLDS